MTFAEKIEVTFFGGLIAVGLPAAIVAIQAIAG
jgi:hypothetical protein